MRCGHAVLVYGKTPGTQGRAESLRAVVVNRGNLLLFGDGGVLAFGANSFNMAIVMPLTGYAVYRAVAGNSSLVSRRRDAPLARMRRGTSI